MSSQSKQQHYDDLTQIKGIGLSTQQWLRETFDVYEYPDLARLSAVELEQKLKANGKIASRSRIEQWLTQAAELASASPTTNSLSDEAAQTSALWKRVATFVVVFEESATQGGKYQTNVHHMEADVTRSWDKIEKHELGDWIIQQLGTEIAALVDVSAEKPVVEPSQPLPEPTYTAPAQPIPEPTHTDKLQHYIAKATALSGQPTQIPHEKPQAAAYSAPSQSMAEPPHADKLQHYMAKAQILSGQTTLKQPEKQQIVPQPVPKRQNPEHTLYSDKLQGYIDKANALAARRSG